MSHRKIPAIKGDNVMIQAQEIELKKLSVNKGQIEGVPTNPRKATKEQIVKLSLKKE